MWCCSILSTITIISSVIDDSELMSLFSELSELSCAMTGLKPTCNNRSSSSSSSSACPIRLTHGKWHAAAVLLLACRPGMVPHTQSGFVTVLPCLLAGWLVFC